MNSVLKDNVEILESNLNNLDRLSDHKFETIVNQDDINDSSDYIYLKIQAHEVEFFAFHNLECSQIKIEIYKSDDTLVNTNGEDWVKIVNGITSQARTYDDILYNRMLFTEKSLLIDFEILANMNGYAKIYIYKNGDNVSLGRLDAGVATDIGYLNYGYNIGSDLFTDPIDNQEDGILEDSYLMNYCKKCSINVNDLKDPKRFIKIMGMLDELSTRTEEIFSIYNKNDSTWEDKTFWVTKKHTWLDRNLKIIMLGSIEHYNFTFENAVVTSLDIDLKGLKK